MLIHVVEKDGTLIASIEVGASDKNVLTVDENIIDNDYLVLIDGMEI